MQQPQLAEFVHSRQALACRVTGPRAPPFAVSCNVQVQFLEMKFSAYLDMSLKQFDSAGLEVVRNESREVSGRAAARLECRGTMGGKG